MDAKEAAFRIKKAIKGPVRLNFLESVDMGHKKIARKK